MRFTRQTKAGNPVSGEISTINDIENTGIDVYFFPYNY